MSRRPLLCQGGDFAQLEPFGNSPESGGVARSARGGPKPALACAASKRWKRMNAKICSGSIGAGTSRDRARIDLFQQKCVVESFRFAASVADIFKQWKDENNECRESQSPS